MRHLRVLQAALLLGLALCVGQAAAGRHEECGDAYERVSAAQIDYWTWALGFSSAQTVGRYYFMPLPDGVPNAGDGSVDNPVIYIGSTEVTVGRHRTLVLPMSVYIGEGYTRESLATDDDPSSTPRAYFLGQTVELTVDRRLVVDSSRRNFACAYFPAAYFPAPLEYTPPQYRYTSDQGIDVYASAALWVSGLAINLPPLAPGRHTIHLFVDTRQGFGYDNTWNVIVRPR